jgi:hypothetical protein
MDTFGRSRCRTVAATALAFLLVATAAHAQIAPPNAAGVAMGHVHVQVPDLEASAAFWVRLGGTRLVIDGSPAVKFPGILVLLSIAVLFSPLPELKSSEANAERSSVAGAAGKGSVFQFPHLWLGVLCLFVYVGVEVLAGDAIGTYGRGFGLPLDQTKLFTTYTLFAMLAGYLVGLAAIPSFVSQERYLAIPATLGGLFALGALLTQG